MVMPIHSIQIFFRISSRFIEAMYGFFILIYLNKILPDAELDFFQIFFFIIGIAYLFFDFGRLQHIIYENNDDVKKQYLSVRFYFFIVLCISSFLLKDLYITLIIFSIFDIASKNSLYDYRKVKNSCIYFLLNLVKLSVTIFIYLESANVIYLMIFLLISICISHFNLKSFINFKDNIKTFFLSNYDFSNFLCHLLFPLFHKLQNLHHQDL